MPGQIMIIDDDPSGLALIEIMLRRSGFEVLKAVNATTALAMLEENIPDLFIVDLMMPGMDGFELCRRLRSHPATGHIPILVLTAREDYESHRRSLEAGADRFLTKPISRHVLVDAINEILS